MLLNDKVRRTIQINLNLVFHQNFALFNIVNTCSFGSIIWIQARTSPPCMVLLPVFFFKLKCIKSYIVMLNIFFKGEESRSDTYFRQKHLPENCVSGMRMRRGWAIPAKRYCFSRSYKLAQVANARSSDPVCEPKNMKYSLITNVIKPYFPRKYTFTVKQL